MAKQYTFAFGSGNPTGHTGLLPTFLIFKTTPGGVNATPPGITEIPTATGLYYFTYGPTNSVAFVIDGATSALSDNIRYLPGMLDPLDAVDEQLTAFSTSAMLGLTGIGQSMQFGFTSIDAKIGATTSSFGSTSIDAGNVFGYLKRLQEFNEGNSVFTKSSGVWDVYTRGSSTQLAQKTLVDSSGSVTKT